MHQYVIVDLAISAQEYLKLYRGLAADVYARARDGKRVRFPARVLQPFVTRDGVVGSFCIYFDQNRKFQSVDRL